MDGGGKEPREGQDTLDHAQMDLCRHALHVEPATLPGSSESSHMGQTVQPSASCGSPSVSARPSFDSVAVERKHITCL